MKKIRVYEYARERNMSSKEVIEILKRLDLPVRNHMSVINDEYVQKIEQYMEQLKSGGKMEQSPTTTSSKQHKEARPAKPKQERSDSSRKRENSKRENNQQQAGTQGRNQQSNNQDRKRKSKTMHVSKSTANQGQRSSKKSRNRAKKKQREAKNAAAQKISSIEVSGSMKVADLATALNVESSDIIKHLMNLGVMATINEELDTDTITILAEEYGVTVEEKKEEDPFEFALEEEDTEALEERPPVVTIMGHVDHGKTTLLDKLRHTNISGQEAGGITQHIGAYQVEYNGKKISFLDTPGHEAFTTMRARGAQVTDIAIIVVAADDGVMPQTKEAIAHAQAAKVPIIVAVNKIDKPEANPDRVKQELTELQLVPEEWGGDTIFVNISALQGEGLDDLMEMILLVSEVEELKANPNRSARGTVVEAQLDKGKGPVATVLIQSGTLRVGDPLVIGNTYGRIRAMMNDRGHRIEFALPSTPVEITGMNDVPQAGDSFLVFEDEKKARTIGEDRAQKQIENEREPSAKVNLDDLFQQIKEGDMKEIHVIIKADVHGSVEALRGALEKIDVEGVRVKIIHSGVGAITESDVILASASNAIIIGFNVRPEPNARQTAENENVDIRLHRIIYTVTEEIESAMKGLLDPVYEEKIIGTIEVRQLFKVSRIGTIAGSYVRDGYVTRDSSVRLIRDGIVVHEGKVQALKRFKDDVREVQNGYECGITIENYNDIKEGDMMEVYVMEEIQPQ